MFKQRRMKIAQVSAATAVSLTLLFTAGCHRDPNVVKQKYLESGKRFEASGKYKEAVIQFSNALKVDKTYGDAHYELAKTYMKMGNAMPAYAELVRTVDANPSNLQARVDLGNLLLAGRSPDRAEAQAKAVLAIDPNFAGAYELLAGVAQKRGDNAEAIKNIQRALQLDPSKASFHTASALLQATTPGNEEAAETELRKAASLDAKSATPHLVLASLLEKKGDNQGAEQEYATAIGIAPTNIQPRAALAGLYFREGNRDKTEQTLLQAVNDIPDNEQASGLLRNYYGQTKQDDRVVGVFAGLTAKYPKSFAIKLTYAQLLSDKKDFAKATAVASDLTKSDGGNPEVQILNAVLLMNTGKTDDAFTLLQKATKDSPNNFQTQMLLGRVAASKGDMAVSESSYRQAAKLNPGNMEVQTQLATIAIRHNDAGALSDVAQKTLQAHPDAAEGYLWRGIAEASQKEYDKAEPDLQTVLKKNPDNSTAYLELALLRIAQGHVPEGKAMLEKAVDKDPNSVRALGMLVGYDMQAKQPAKALARVQAAIAKAPNNGSLYAQLAAVQLQTKDYKGALDNAGKAMQLTPGNAGAVQAYTEAQIALGQTDSAVATWEKWATTHPTDAHAMVILGSLEEGRGDKAKSMDYYKKALQIDSDNGVAANNLAYLMVDNGENADVALTYAQTARRNLPDSPQTADTLAWVYYYKANYSSARDLLEDTLKTSPDNVSLHYHLGMTYLKLSDKTNAQAQLKKAAALDPTGKTGKDAAAELAKM
jgi:tetratricopeptide (TPR) repeat protein